MDTLLQSIRAAVADGATDEAKQAGATACRTILAALEATEGQPLASPAAPAAPIAATVAALRGVPPDQLLDLVIAKLRTVAPASSAPMPGARLAIPLVKVRTP